MLDRSGDSGKGDQDLSAEKIGQSGPRAAIRARSRSSAKVSASPMCCENEVARVSRLCPGRGKNAAALVLLFAAMTKMTTILPALALALAALPAHAEQRNFTGPNGTYQGSA